jgi:SAM-dependent methyltransferase
MTFEASADVYARHVGRYGSALADQLIDFAGVRRGARVLDVGCGPGALTEAVAGVVGAENVTAVDPSASFVAACRERVPDALVLQGTAEALPVRDGSFDAVLSQLVVNFLEDPEAGVRQMAAAATADGVVAACVWDYAGEMQMLRAFWDAALALDPDAPDEGKTMSFCTPAELADLWTRGGLDDVAADALVVSARYDDFDDYWRPFPTGVAPSGAYCASLPPERQTALREECRRRLGDPKREFTLSARAWAVRGRAG